MTFLAINFPGPDSNDAPQTLRTALSNAARILGTAPRIGLLLKTKKASDGEVVSHWGLVDPNKIVPQDYQDLPSAPVAFEGFPPTGIILKIKEDEAGERLVNWMLADPSQIETFVVGLSINSSIKNHAKQGVHIS